MYNNNKKMILALAMSILLALIFPASAGTLDKQPDKADLTEGGHLETDFGANFMAEWWYLNGKATMVSSEGEKLDMGFFVILAHQESPMFNGYSHLLTFNGLYFNNGTTASDYTEIYIPRGDVDRYIALHTPYVDYKYPGGLKEINGSARSGYNLKYVSDNSGVDMDVFFQTNMEKTVDHADRPLNFTAYERSYGALHGSITLNGKRYNITKAEAYMDHMIPVSAGPWPMDMHGWNWFEVTTKDYQAVAYAVRGPGDGYDNYSYKHLTLLNKHNGKVLAEYSADEITITETEWIDETAFNRKRPSRFVFSTRDLNVAVNAEKVIYFDRSNPNAIGFVDFMAFQPEGAWILYNGTAEAGGAFSEYLVSDIGALAQR